MGLQLLIGPGIFFFARTRARIYRSALAPSICLLTTASAPKILNTVFLGTSYDLALTYPFHSGACRSKQS
jgi:hypothetical protein